MACSRRLPLTTRSQARLAAFMQAQEKLGWIDGRYIRIRQPLGRHVSWLVLIVIASRPRVTNGRMQPVMICRLAGSRRKIYISFDFNQSAKGSMWHRNGLKLNFGSKKRRNEKLQII